MKTTCFILITLVFGTCAHSQESKYVEGKIYKNAKVLLTSGVTIKGEDLMISGSNLNIVFGSPLRNAQFKLEKVQEILIPTRSYAGIGFITGAAIGAITMFLVEIEFEKPKTTTESDNGWTSTTTTTKIMAPGPKIAMVAGGALLGTLIGKSIKRGWKKIYPSKEINISFNFSTDCYPNPSVCLQIQF